jgi:threonine dehydrogenase-like Zn-dependent dehydrogenase
MKALALTGPRALEFVEIGEPQLGPEDVLVAVGCVGLCGTDLSAYRGLSSLVAYPRIPGHEVGGVIAEVASDVPAAIRIGDRVTISPYSHCGACRACRMGRTNSCLFNQTLGVQRDGALTERIAVNYRQVYSSSLLLLEELALVEPLAVGCHGVNMGRVTADDTVLVLGCGAVGLGAVAAAASKGATVIAADVEQSKAELARKLGAAHAVNAATDDLAGRIAALTAGDGPSVVVEAAGQTETTRIAIEVAASAARVVCIGYVGKPVELDTGLITKKELEVLGSRNALDEFSAAIAILEQRDRSFIPMVTRVADFDEAPQAFAEWSALSRTFTKVLIRVARE